MIQQGARALLCALALGMSAGTVAAPFTYNTYNSMIADLQALENAHPGLAELTTAQDAFGLPLDGFDGDLSQYILRITNEATGFDKPEVLIVGVQHGDEVVSLEVALETARLLLEQYGQNAWLTSLVNRREIYIMPLANPQGFLLGRRSSPGSEASNEDMNRDHIYDRDDCQFFCSDEFSLSTIGSRAIHELGAAPSVSRDAGFSRRRRTDFVPVGVAAAFAEHGEPGRDGCAGPGFSHAFFWRTVQRAYACRYRE